MAQPSNLLWFQITWSLMYCRCSRVWHGPVLEYSSLSLRLPANRLAVLSYGLESSTLNPLISAERSENPKTFKLLPKSTAKRWRAQGSAARCRREIIWVGDNLWTLLSAEFFLILKLLPSVCFQVWNSTSMRKRRGGGGSGAVRDRDYSACI